MGRKTRAALCGAVWVCATGLAVRAQEPRNNPSSEWKPGEAQLARLAAEVRIQDWAIRPPRDTRIEVDEGMKERRDRWTLPQTGMTLMVRQGKGPEGTLASDTYTNAFMNRIKNPPSGMTLGPPERGIINGKEFLRTRYSLELPPGVRTENKRTFGFIYVSVGGDPPFMLDGSGPAGQVEIAEASVLTFHLLKAEAPPK